VPGCQVTFTAESEDAIMGEIAAHARDGHGMNDVPDDVMAQVRAGITDA
jgi:predicted small metal-binding protein